MTRIGLHGAAGHMGRTLIRAISESAVCTVAGGCERPESPTIGEDLGSLAGLPPLGLHIDRRRSRPVRRVGCGRRP